jgi:hypothetical protein
LIKELKKMKNQKDNYALSMINEYFWRAFCADGFSIAAKAIDSAAISIPKERLIEAVNDNQCKSGIKTPTTSRNCSYKKERILAISLNKT